MIALAPHRRWIAPLRWGVAGLAIVAAHGGGAWMALNWRPIAPAAAGAPEQAIMIELAALSVAPEAPAENLPVAPERVEAEQPPEPVKDTPPDPEPVPEPVLDIPLEQPPPDPELTRQPEPEIKLPDLPSLPNAAATLAPPPPPKTVVEKPKPKPKPKVVERKPDRPKAKQAAAPQAAPAQASAPTASSQGASAQPSVSPASWRGTLIAHLNRYKRFPSGANPGTAQVAFTIDRGGRVLSASLVSSSGVPSLDEEAVAMMRRASPVPAPPPGVGGAGSITLSVPVRFNR